MHWGTDAQCDLQHKLTISKFLRSPMEKKSIILKYLFKHLSDHYHFQISLGNFDFDYFHNSS